MKLDWYIARRYLAARRGGRLLSVITWIALGGVTVGVTALIVVIGVMTGMQKDLRSKILSSTPHVLVLEQGSALRMGDWRSVVDTVLTVEGVRAASPFVLTSVAVRRGAYAQPAQFYGVPTDSTLAGGTLLEEDILRGLYNLETPSSGLPPLLMGSTLAARMQVFTGDTLLLISFENLRVDVFGAPTPTLQNFEVTGMFTTGMYDYDSQNVYARLEDAQTFVGLADRDMVSGVGVQTVDPELAPEIADEIQRKLGGPYAVASWVETNRALFSALKLEKLAMFVILFLIVLVAAFNIVSTLIMVVADRTREIGILKSMGMTDRGILRVFVLQGAWIGVVGTVLGTVLGVFLCWLLDTFEIIRIPPEVYFVDRLPVSLEVGDVLSIVAASIVVAFAATVYPSLQAARLEPVEAIRHD